MIIASNLHTINTATNNVCKNSFIPTNLYSKHWIFVYILQCMHDYKKTYPLDELRYSKGLSIKSRYFYSFWNLCEIHKAI